MQLNHFRNAFAAAVTALVLLMAHGAHAAPEEKSKRPSASVLAAQRDADPALNGSVGDALPVMSDASLQAAARAARRDTDPDLNGSALADQRFHTSVVGGPTLDTAWSAYERCHWNEAFTAFAAFADAGDSEAARMAMAMARHGPALYGQTFEIAADRLRSWHRLGKLPSTSVSTVQASTPIAQP